MNFKLIIVFGLLQIALMAIFTLLNPYPPIFNIHAFSALDIGYHFRNSLDLPFLNIEKMITISAQSNLYSQLNIFGYMLSFFAIDNIPKENYVLISNLLSQFIFISSALFILKVFNTNEKKISAVPFLFIIITLSIPPIYEVFIKYASSDVYVFFCSVGILVFSIKSLKEERIHHLIFLIAFSVILRTYFVLICILFLLLFQIFFYLKKKTIYIKILKNIFLKKMNIVFLIFSLIISISWFSVLFSNYNIMIPDFQNYKSSNNIINSADSETVQKYSTSLISSNVAEGSSIKELFNSIINTNIYYKTFDKDKEESKNNVLIFFNFIFSTPIIFLLIISLLTYSIYYFIFKKNKFKDEIIICLLWILSVSLSWLLLIGSSYPIVKILISAIPAIAIIIIAFLLEFIKNENYFNYKIFVILIFLFSSFCYNNFFNQSFFIEKNKNDFLNKYGYKKEIIKAIENNKINNSEILWMVRPEHGGFISFFIDDIRIWDRNWYENLKFNKIHSTKDEKSIIKFLINNKIKYIISMDNKKLVRFYYTHFKKNLNYDHKLIGMLENNKKYFHKIIEERPYKGAELSMFILNDEFK